MLIPNTAAPIASQNTTWNDQKIRLRHLGSDRRSAAILGGATPVAFATCKPATGDESMGAFAEWESLMSGEWGNRGNVARAVVTAGWDASSPHHQYGAYGQPRQPHGRPVSFRARRRRFVRAIPDSAFSCVRSPANGGAIKRLQQGLDSHGLRAWRPIHHEARGIQCIGEPLVGECGNGDKAISVLCRAGHAPKTRGDGVPRAEHGGKSGTGANFAIQTGNWLPSPFFPSGHGASDDAAAAERGGQLRGGIEHGFAGVGMP